MLDPKESRRRRQSFHVFYYYPLPLLLYLYEVEPVVYLFLLEPTFHNSPSELVVLRRIPSNSLSVASSTVPSFPKTPGNSRPDRSLVTHAVGIRLFRLRTANDGHLRLLGLSRRWRRRGADGTRLRTIPLDTSMLSADRAHSSPKSLSMATSSGPRPLHGRRTSRKLGPERSLASLAGRVLA